MDLIVGHGLNQQPFGSKSCSLTTTLQAAPICIDLWGGKNYLNNFSIRQQTNKKVMRSECISSYPSCICQKYNFKLHRDSPPDDLLHCMVSSLILECLPFQIALDIRVWTLVQYLFLLGEVESLSQKNICGRPIYLLYIYITIYILYNKTAIHKSCAVAVLVCCCCTPKAQVWFPVWPAHVERHNWLEGRWVWTTT